jgi:hypothetical protein
LYLFTTLMSSPWKKRPNVRPRTKNKAPGTGWAGWPSPIGPWGPGGLSPRFFPGLLLFDFLLRPENLKGSLNKEIEVPRVFLFGLFIWPNWELENPSHQAIFCTHAATMVSPRSVELKQGAIDGGGEAMRAQAIRRDQEDCPHPLRRVCPDRSYRFSQPRRRGEGRCASVA